MFDSCSTVMDAYKHMLYSLWWHNDFVHLFVELRACSAPIKTPEEGG